MENVVDPFAKIDRFCDVILQVCEFIQIDVLNIPCIFSYQIIDTDNLMFFLKQKIA